MSGPRRPALDPVDAPLRPASASPEPFRSAVRGREKRILGDPLGLTQFGVNLVTLHPGDRSALRHWHSHEDEFVFVVDGELVLVTEAGEQPLRAGQCAGFPAGVADGHCLVNRGIAVARYLEVGSRRPGDDLATYPDDDVAWVREDGRLRLVHKDGTPW